jgi:AraC-like DNA-binding protein
LTVDPLINSDGFRNEESPVIPSASSPELKESIKDFPDRETEIGVGVEKYKKSGLSEVDLQIIYKRLTDLMQRDKLYTDPEITLGDVAQRLDIHSNYLSQVINTVLKKNFYDYINGQRVEEFVRLVGDPDHQHFTLLALAFNCGFNSKTSFNRNFRKVTGVSPSRYQETVLAGSEDAG